MSNINTPLLNNDPFSKWGNSVRDTIRETQIVRATDVDVSSSPYGTFVGLKNDTKYPTPTPVYRGEWNPMISYDINDIVRVLPGKTYNLKWDTTPWEGIDVSGLYFDIGTPFYDGKISGIRFIVPKFTPVAGTYICTSPVPDINYTITLLNVLNANLPLPGYLTAIGNLSDYSPESAVYKNVNYLRFNDVNYYPVWPEMPNQAKLDNDLKLLKGRYWDLMSLLPDQTFVCADGVTTAQYTDTQTIPSGSANYTGSYSGAYQYT